MAKLSIRYTSDFNPLVLFATWAAVSLLPGLLVWVLGTRVPRSIYFPAPMINSVNYGGPAYASLITALGLSFLAAIYLSSKLRTTGVNPFVRFISFAAAAGAAYVLGGANPFASTGLVGEVLRTILLIGDWVVIGIVATLLSFVLSHGLALAIGRH